VSARARTAGKLLLANVGVWLLLELVAFVVLSVAPAGADPSDKDWLTQARMSFEGGLYVWDEHCLWRLQPDYEGGDDTERKFWGDGPLRVNEHGMRGPAVTQAKPNGTRRILILGGSHPMGMYVDYDQSYGARLQAALGSGWQVLNAAAPGHTSYQAREYLAWYGVAFSPDIVIADVGVNDTLPLTPQFPLPDDEVQRPPRWVVDATTSLRFSAVYRLLRRWMSPDAPAVSGGQRVSADKRLANVQAMRALGEERGFKVLLINQFRADLRGSGRIQCLFEDTGAEAVVDACAMWAERGDVRGFFADPVHANAAGHALLAELFQARLTQLGWL